MLYHSHDCTQDDLTPCSQTRTMAVVQLCPVDFVSRLPPEIVLDIVLNLGVEDVVQCLLVSKQWHDILSGLEPYWRRACLEFGLPDHVVGRLRPRYATSKALLFAARQHRQSICATRPQCFSLSQEGYPYDTHYACQYTNGDMILGTVYRDFRPKEIIVERVCYRSVVRVRTLFPQFASTAENRIIWGYLSQEYLLCVTASGIWSAYDSSINSPLFRWKSDSMYDSDIRIGCCEKCLIVCTAKLFSFRNEESYWDLKVFKVGRDFSTHVPSVMKFKIFTGNREITLRQASCGKKRIWLLPSSKHTDTDGFCRSHTLLIQWAHTVAAHALTSKAKTCILSRHPRTLLTIPCRREHIELAIVRNHGLNTEFCLSADSKLLGMIFQSHLHVWDVSTSEKLCCAEIILDQYSHEQLRLIALGHIYSIVGLEFKNAVLVVATQTGKVVLKYAGFARKHGRMVPPYIEFLSAVSEDWLNDISCPCSTARPTVVYWNKTNRCIEGVAFGQPYNFETKTDVAKPSQKKSWWNWKWKLP